MIREKDWQIGRKYKRRLEGNIKKNKEGNGKKPPVPYASGAFFMHQAAKVLPGGGTIEIPFVYISLTAFIRALYQRNR
jgi:hypothetical protein